MHTVNFIKSNASNSAVNTPALVTLIRPPVVVARWAHTTPTCPPIGLAYIAGSIIAAGHQVKVVDAIGEAHEQFVELTDKRFLSHGLTTAEIVEKIDLMTEVIGISCMFSHEWPLTREIIHAVRERLPKALIIAGGEHITGMPIFSLDNCSSIDVGVLGEGEETLLELLAYRNQPNNFRNIKGLVIRQDNNCVLTETRPRIRSVNNIPEPAWDLFPLEIYLDNEYGFGVNRGRSLPVMATRGCPYQCTFCSNPTMWTTRWVARDPESVLNEIIRLSERYKIDNVDFYDLTAIVKKSWIIEFCNLIINGKFKFTWQLPSGTRSEAIDEEVSRLLYASGCRNMSYAPESGSDRVLKRIKKKIDLKEMKQSMKGAIKAGINCKANIILGFPGETHQEVFETLKFCIELGLLGLQDLSISPFSPYPGSELFNDLQKSGVIKEYSDEYFYSLAAYTDLSKTVSMSENISNGQLGFYRISGMFLFYSFSFLVRPWRLLFLLQNVFFSKRQESRLEMSLVDLKNRVLKVKSDSQATA
jgi:radical SAM superfamily enzyme YgiQ (UPF0313 family)